MFSVDRYNKISITKGDNAELEVKVVDKEGIERQIFADDELILTVRKTIEEEAVITKTAEDGVFYFIPEDTKDLIPGQYIYDIQLTTFAGKVYTITPISRFEIMGEVSE